MENTDVIVAEDYTNTDKPVFLGTPIVRGKTQIIEVLVTKPNTGALRGIKLTALLDMDVTAISTVLPRVTIPTLTKEELNDMDPADFLELGMKIIGFFTKKSATTDFQSN